MGISVGDGIIPDDPQAKSMGQTITITADSRAEKKPQTSEDIPEEDKVYYTENDYFLKNASKD